MISILTLVGAPTFWTACNELVLAQMSKLHIMYTSRKHCHFTAPMETPLLQQQCKCTLIVGWCAAAAAPGHSAT